MIVCSQTDQATVYCQEKTVPVVTVLSATKEVCVNSAWYQYRVIGNEVVIENYLLQPLWRFPADGWAEFAESQAS
jgi:hypothetical protein